MHSDTEGYCIAGRSKTVCGQYKEPGSGIERGRRNREEAENAMAHAAAKSRSQTQATEAGPSSAGISTDSAQPGPYDRLTKQQFKYLERKRRMEILVSILS